jgi:HK97 family phage major capsid protein
MLQKKQAEARAKARAIHDLAAREGRLTTDAEDTDFRAHMAEAAGYDAKIADAQALLEAERTAPAVAAAALAATAGRAIVVHNNREDEPFASLGEKLVALRTHVLSRGATTDVRIQAALGSSETSDADGGILVDPQYSDSIWKRTYDVGILAARCAPFPMTKARLIMKAVDENSRVDGSRWGGIQSYWTAEAGSFQFTKAKFRAMEIVANKLTVLTSATDEEMEDAPALQAYNDMVVPDELAFKLDTAIWGGPGAGAPLGFTNSGAAVVVPKDNGQTLAANPYTTQNILNMTARLFVRSIRTAAFFTNQAALPFLRSLTVGTGTAVRLLFTPATKDDIENGIVGYMEGFPVIVIEQAAAVGTQGDIALADLQSYLLAKRGGITAASSIHVAFLTGEQVFRWQARMDGQPLWKAPLTPYNGGPTISPFVVLDTRT